MSVDSHLIETPPVTSCDRRLSRREMLGAAGTLFVGGSLALGLRQWTRYERGLRASVFIGRATDYRADLTRIIVDGLSAIGIDRKEVRGKRILLKPNLVETALGHQHINTHPAVVVAAAEAFRRLGAADVFVAEGQGHRRDSMLVLDESGMAHAIDQARLSFVDLNHDDVEPIDNRGRWTTLRRLYLPKTLLAADWVVSLPKMKTHHWAGMTCAMKNFFGVMPGIVYGWPKNVLHHHGIDECILDINATVQPTLAIADGIIGMEGDGPIMGTPKSVGCVLVSRSLPALDATATRVMGLNPYGVRYLKEASGRLGPIHSWNIAQRGETIDAVKTQFEVLDVPHLAAVRHI